MSFDILSQINNNLLHENNVIIMEKMRRIALESVDTALHVCNKYIYSFGFAKLHDVFNQILPTAFALNTGYWPFYISTSGGSLCVCEKYGFYCNHVFNVTHWLNLSPIPNTEKDDFFIPTKNSPFICQACEIYIDPVVSTYYKNVIELKIELHWMNNEVNSTNDSKISYRQCQVCTLTGRYEFFRELFPSDMNYIVFHPNPILTVLYGTHISELKRLKLLMEINHKNDLNSNIMINVTPYTLFPYCKKEENNDDDINETLKNYFLHENLEISLQDVVKEENNDEDNKNCRR